MTDHRNDDPQHDELHAIFGALREHVVEVVDDFAERVSARIDELSSQSDRFESPSLLRVLFSSLVQTLNITTTANQKEDDDEPR